MSLFPVIREDVMPRMRAYLTRAGYASPVSEISGEIEGLAREIYLRGLELAVPLAAVAEIAAENFPGDIPPQLGGYRAYSIMFFSLGIAIDEEIGELLDAGETLRAVLLDAWGSEAVEALAEVVDARLRRERGCGSMRFAPGYSGYDIRNNFHWFEAIFSETTWIDDKIYTFDCSVNPETGIITPRKSVICAVGWRDA